MKRLYTISTAVLMLLAVPALTVAQARPDFSGRWKYNQDKSSRGSSGNEAVIQFPSVLVIKQTPAELHVEMGTLRQDDVTAIYKFDGSEVTVSAPEGITEKAKATWNGPRLVISLRRSFTSPIGDVVTEFKETWTLNGNLLTIEKIRTAEGVSDTERAVYDKTASS